MKKSLLFVTFFIMSGCYYTEPIVQDVYVMDTPNYDVVQQDVYTQTDYIYQQPSTIYIEQTPSVVYVDDAPDVVYYSGPVLIGSAPRYHHRGYYHHRQPYHHTVHHRPHNNPHHTHNGGKQNHHRGKH